MAQSSSWRHADTMPGVVLLAAAALSFVLLNSSVGHAFHGALERPFAFGVTAHLAINDGLMAIFFLYVGLELKREFLEGPLRDIRTAALPFSAALGGMAAPALIYLAIAGSADPAFAKGWAIPAATDIAFALGVLSLLGKRAPRAARPFLLALAVIDDLGAILVIAVFYTETIVGWALAAAALAFVAMLLMNRWGVRALTPYWLAATFLWAFMLFSGVHPTIAGVLAAFAFPMRRADGRSPLITAEHALKGPVQLAIMPIFALANAGVPVAGLGLGTFLHPVALGAGLGLLLGKPAGILSATWLAAKVLRRTPPLPAATLAGLALVAGVGFTMSLFIGALAFGAGDLAAPVRFGVLGGSLISALLGAAVMFVAGGRSDADSGQSPPQTARRAE